ncbi:hypothetical protein ACFLUS_04415 [Chloroflexota bacterium]
MSDSSEEFQKATNAYNGAEEVSDSSEEFQKATNAYNGAIELYKLVSEQFYSRLSSFLAGNSLIIAAIAILITGRIEVPQYVVLSLIIGGLILSCIFIYMVAEARQASISYRKRIAEVEEAATGQVIVHKGEYNFFGALTYLTILVFAGIYLTLLVFIVYGGA